MAQRGPASHDPTLSTSQAVSGARPLAATGLIVRTGPPGRQTAWRRFGDGPPLVLLHGGHGSWLHWARNITALATRHTVWVPDMPGYGDSDTPAAPTLDALLNDLSAGLDEVIGPRQPFALAGFSFGGLVAAHLAARAAGRETPHPATPQSRIAALALLGPAGHGTPRRPRAELLGWRDLAGTPDSRALQEVMRHNLAAHMLHAPDAVDDLALQLHTQACLRTRMHSKPISRGGGLQACLDAYRGPLLMLWGEHDVTTTPRQAQALFCAGRIEGRSAIVPDAGHWVQYEAAAHVNAQLTAFMGACAPP